jgi:hypothetical protein
MRWASDQNQMDAEYGVDSRLLFANEYATVRGPVTVVAVHGVSGGVCAVTYVDVHLPDDGARVAGDKIRGHVTPAEADVVAERLSDCWAEG